MLVEFVVMLSQFRNNFILLARVLRLKYHELSLLRLESFFQSFVVEDVELLHLLVLAELSLDLDYLQVVLQGLLLPWRHLDSEAVRRTLQVSH